MSAARAGPVTRAWKTFCTVAATKRTTAGLCPGGTSCTACISKHLVPTLLLINFQLDQVVLHDIAQRLLRWKRIVVCSIKGVHLWSGRQVSAIYLVKMVLEDWITNDGGS